MKSDDTSMIWLSADYHFPSTYSCRFPMSSIGSAQIIPTPGPATIRLALIRTSIELFGIERTREELFPTIRAVAIVIRPPMRIAISKQNLRAYKASVDNWQTHARLDESIIYREFAHTSDSMTIYLQVSTQYSGVIETLLRAVGYWGQASSFAQCTRVECVAPLLCECAVSLRTVSPGVSVRQLITGFVTEFRDSNVTWYQIIVGLDEERIPTIQAELYVWPMKIIEQHGGGRRLLRCSIADDTESA